MSSHMILRLAVPVRFLILCGLVAPLLGHVGSAMAQQTQIPDAEYAALVALYNTADGPSWANTWTLPTDNPCSLYGVSCADGHVTELLLWQNSLSGAIPSELGVLTGLTVLSLDQNQLSGAIPPELGALANLWYLGLSGNQLSGGIPPELGMLASLLYLALAGNQLSGTIPPELGALTNLTSLSLDQNQFGGTIPP
jgi:Leucine-rich repeat (LRR) protein